jgi:hypothetical protein
MIFETNNFFVESKKGPFVDRDEGGTLRLCCKIPGVKNRTELTPPQAVEFAWITMLTGEAYTNAMRAQGVDIIKLNYQDMGNWYYKYNHPEFLHLYIFGRVLGAKHQPFPEAVYLPDRSTGFYNGFKELTAEDETAIRNEILRLIKTEKYNKKNWVAE